MTKLRALLRGEGFLGADREAVVELSSDTALLARLQEPLWHDGVPINHVVVQVRHESDGFCDLKPGQEFSATSRQFRLSERPRETRWICPGGVEDPRQSPTWRSCEETK